MNKQLIAVIAVAVVLFAVALVGAFAFTGSDSGAGNAHTMPNGQMMTGMMEDDSMMGHTMSNGGTMTGSGMPGMTHSSP